MKKICHCFKEKDCYSQVIRICEIEALLLHIHIVGCGLSNSLSFAFSLLFAIINPWQHSGNSSSESQWKSCNRNKNKAYCKRNLN